MESLELKTENKDVKNELDYKILLENSLSKTVTKSHLHPFMKPYVNKTKNGFSLNFRFTVSELNKLISYINNMRILNPNFKILFVDIKSDIIEDTFENRNLPSNTFYTNKWINGFLTNYQFTNLKEKEISSDLSKLEKKRIEKKHNNFKGLLKMTSIPDLVICSNMSYCVNVINECKKTKVKVASIVSCNGNPRLVDFPIIANDNNDSSIRFIFEHILNNIFKSNSTSKIEI